MAENKKSFTAYCDWNTTFNSLPDDKAGQLIKHLFAYVNDENPETDDLLINAVFANIKATLKRDLKKWEEKSKKNQEIAFRRWQTKANESIKENANVCERIKPNANYADSVSDSVSDILIQPKVVINWDSLLTQFNNLTKREFKLINDATKKQILTRLKEGYTKEDLWNAIQNCYNDDFHKENNHKYLTLEFISRAKMMEKYSVDVVKSKKIDKSEIGKL
jgi:uncharacterized phage protein (TIGR02220 family)